MRHKDQIWKYVDNKNRQEKKEADFVNYYENGLDEKS